MAINDHTGDSLTTKPANDNYRNGYDAIFRNQGNSENQSPDSQADIKPTAIAKEAGDVPGR